MTACANDVELPRDQEPLNPDALPIPTKPWSRRMVLMAVTLGGAAILGTMAVFGSTAGGQVASVNHNDHIDFLKRYAQMQNKTFARLFSRHLADDKKPNLSKECQKAFKKQAAEQFKKGMELSYKAFAQCITDHTTDACKDACNTLKNFNQVIKEDCKAKGHLCTVKATDKNGEKQEETCIPTVCQDETDKIKKFVEDVFNCEIANIEECTDFDCTVSLECGE